MTLFPYALFYRRPLNTIVAFAALNAAIATLASILCSHLLWNATPSVPRGLYWLSHDTRELALGDIVVFPIPAAVRPLLSARHYLPPNYKMLKPVAARAQDDVCVRDDVVTVNALAIGTVRHVDGAGRPLPVDATCQQLQPHQLYVVAPHPSSFDSRAFGPVDDRAITAKATPLWTY